MLGQGGTAVCLLSSCTALAYSEIVGKLQGSAPAHACAELESTGAERIQLRAPVDGMGDFRFEGVPAGRYELRLRTASSEVVYRQPLIVEEAVIYVRAAVAGPRPPPRPGTVSAAELAQRYLARLRRSFARPSRRSRAGGSGRPSLTWRRPSAGPGYARAYNYLGACLGTLGEFGKAEEALRRAVDLDPGSAEARTNLAHALLALSRR